MSIATLSSDKLAGPAPSGVERLIVRGSGVYDLVDLHENGVMTRWEHRGRTELNGDARTLLQLSGIEIPDGQLRRYQRHSGVKSGSVQVTTGSVSYACGATVDLLSGTLHVDRAIHNRGFKDVGQRHALMLGVSLTNAGAGPQIQDGIGRRFAANDFPLNETVVQRHGGTLAVDSYDTHVSLTSNARIVVGDEFLPKEEPELSLLVHRTEEVLYVGAAVCGEGGGVVLPPGHELQIDGSVALG